jgi:hypothetical protein
MNDDCYLIVRTKCFWPVRKGSILKYEGDSKITEDGLYEIRMRVLDEPNTIEVS